MVKGESPTMKTLEGKYPLVVTAAYRRTANTYQIDGEAVCIPLVSSTGHGDAAIHRVHYQNGKFALANLLVALLPKDPSICNARYLYHLLMTKKEEYLVSLMRGTANVSLKEQDIYNVEVSLPPVEEQRRIVGRIEELAGKIAEARGLRERSIEESNNLYPATLTSIMQSHQEDWTQESVSDVVIDISAGWSPQCDGYPASDGEWGVLKTTSVQWNKFIANENKALPKSMQPRPSLTVQKGDVLVTRAGPRQRVGVVAAARENHSNLMISDKIIRLKPDLHKIDPRFLEISLSSPFSQEYLVSRKTGLADAQVNISQSIIRGMPISYPSLPEQHRIVSYLDALQANVDTAKCLRQESLKELDALLPAILDKAFKGEL